MKIHKRNIFRISILRLCIFITLLRLYLNKVTVRSYSTRGKPLLTVKVDRHCEWTTGPGACVTELYIAHCSVWDWLSHKFYVNLTCSGSPGDYYERPSFALFLVSIKRTIAVTRYWLPLQGCFQKFEHLSLQLAFWCRTVKKNEVK